MDLVKKITPFAGIGDFKSANKLLIRGVRRSE
jgi:hypothetical protein